MLVELEEIPPEGLEITFDLEPSFFELTDKGLDISERVSFNCSLVKSGKEVYMQGDMRTGLKLVCARCLVPFKIALGMHLEICYLPKWAVSDKEEVELDSSDLNKYYYEGGAIDLKDAVRDYIATAVPMKPLCREDCKGLCYKCGKNLNIEACNCEPDEFDDRFETLQGLKF